MLDVMAYEKSDLFVVENNALFEKRDLLANYFFDQMAIIDDSPLDPALLPVTQQMAITARCDIGIELEYCVPFRYLGRVILAAMMPKLPEPVNPKPNKSRASDLVVDSSADYDPIVPFFVTRVPNLVQRIHRQAIASFLLSQNPDYIIGQNLNSILRALSGSISISEAAYYYMAMVNLANGSWRHVPAFLPAIAAESLVTQQELRDSNRLVRQVFRRFDGRR